MKPTGLVIIIWFVLTGSLAFAQEEKTELGVFVGGYFNSGFQSFTLLNPTTRSDRQLQTSQRGQQRYLRVEEQLRPYAADGR